MKKHLEEIQDFYYELQALYAKVGGLRDGSPSNEKERCNKIRGLLNECSNEVQRWENSVIEKMRGGSHA